MTNHELRKLGKARARRRRYLRKKHIAARELRAIDKGTKRGGFSVAFVPKPAFRPKKRVRHEPEMPLCFFPPAPGTVFSYPPIRPWWARLLGWFRRLWRELL